MPGLVEYSRPLEVLAVHHKATALRRPRCDIFSCISRRTSSNGISELRSKSKPARVCEGPSNPTFVSGWLSKRVAHHQKSALSFDELCRKALNGLMSNSPILSERSSIGVTDNSTVFGMWCTLAFGAIAVTAACAVVHEGTIPLESKSGLKSSVMITTCLTFSGKFCLRASVRGSFLAKPSLIATVGSETPLAFATSRARFANRADCSNKTTRPPARRAASSAGRMEPNPRMTMNAPSGPAAMASL
mmetsp:Transcript_29500/g.74128  ORF Transcript_29500/g.74128 Transcript_29500/m.74128 type:complete len:246 (-) Transcript_29500:910-1647(-)